MPELHHPSIPATIVTAAAHISPELPKPPLLPHLFAAHTAALAELRRTTDPDQFEPRRRLKSCRQLQLQPLFVPRRRKCPARKTQAAASILYSPLLSLSFALMKRLKNENKRKRGDHKRDEAREKIDGRKR
jgi:hypothetical protein